MSRELLQQALGALGTSTWDHTRAVGKQELITALRAALAQPEPWQGAEEWESLAWELAADIDSAAIEIEDQIAAKGEDAKKLTQLRELLKGIG